MSPLDIVISSGTVSPNWLPMTPATTPMSEYSNCKRQMVIEELFDDDLALYEPAYASSTVSQTHGEYSPAANEGPGPKAKAFVPADPNLVYEEVRPLSLDSKKQTKDTAGTKGQKTLPSIKKAYNFSQQKCLKMAAKVRKTFGIQTAREKKKQEDAEWLDKFFQLQKANMRRMKGVHDEMNANDPSIICSSTCAFCQMNDEDLVIEETTQTKPKTFAGFFKKATKTEKAAKKATKKAAKKVKAEKKAANKAAKEKTKKSGNWAGNFRLTCAFSKKTYFTFEVNMRVNSDNSATKA